MAEDDTAGRPDYLHIVLIYAAFAGLWILLSDKAVIWLIADPERRMWVSMVKGWVFVAVTSLLLYVLLRRVLGRGGAGESDASRRGLLPIVAGALAVIVLLVGFGIAHTLVSQRDKEVARMQAIADLKTRMVVEWLRERRGDAAFVRSSYFCADQYRRWRGSGDEAAGARLKARLEQLRENRGLGAVMVLDPDGNRLWGSAGAPVASTEMLSMATRAVAADGRAHMVGPYRGADGHPSLDFVVPLAGIPGPAPMVVLHVDPEAWLFPTLQAWTSPSGSGETVLFQRDGNAVSYLNDPRHGRDAAAKSRLPLAGDDRLTTRAVRGEVAGDGVVSGRDYGDVEAIGVVRAIPDTGWFLLAKIDRSELYAGAGAQITWIALMGVFAVLMTLAGATLLRQRQQLALAWATRQSERERLNALRLLQTIAEASDDAIFAKDGEGRYILFNPAAERIFDKPAGQVLGRDDHAVFPGEQAEWIVAIDKSTMAGNESRQYELRLPRAEGDRVVEVTKVPLRGDGGAVVGVFGIARDVTERKRAEAELGASEARFRALVEQSLAGIYIIQDGRFRYLNPGFAAIFGYDAPADIVDHLAVADLVSPEDRGRVAENIRRRVAGEIDDVHYVFVGLRRDGARIDVEVHGRVLDYEGRPAVIGLILDITARKTAEDSLRESELRFHDIVRASADWVWEVDADGRYTYASDSVFDMLGYTASEIVGRTPFDLMPADEAGRVRALFADIAARKVAFRDLDNINLRKDGAPRHVSTNGMPVLDGLGKLLGYRGLDRDVTEKKEAEAAFRRMADDMVATLRAVPDLLFELDRDGRYLNVRATQERLLAAPVAQLLGHTVTEMLPAEAARTVMAALDAADGRGSDYGRMIELPFPDGSARHFELSVARKERAGEGGRHFILLSRDVTERKRTEAELRGRNEELERFNRAMVGRELDMLELKKRVNALSRELGREAPFPLDFLRRADAGEAI